MFRPLMVILPLVLATGLAACDGEDYEARVVELEGELETTRGQNEKMRAELEEARTRLQELEQTQAGGVGGETLQQPIENALAAIAESDSQLDRLQATAATQEQVDPAALDEVRQQLRQAAEAIGNVAEAAQIELQQVAPPR